MFLFRGKKEVPSITSARKATPDDIYIAMEALHQHKLAQNQKYIRQHRNLEELRNNLTQTTLEEIANHRQDTPENYAICRQAIINLLLNNMQQTQNYSRWHMTANDARNLSLGKIHKLCVSLMPDAFIDAIIIMRSRRLPKIIRVTTNINPETNEETQSKEITIPPRNFQNMDFYLKKIDNSVKKILVSDQRFQTLLEEDEINKFISTLDIQEHPDHLKYVLSQAKAIYTDFHADKLNKEQYQEFKQLVVNVYQILDKPLEQQLTKFITHMEKIQELVDYGREMTAKRSEHHRRGP